MSGAEATGIGRTGAGWPCAWRRAFTAGLAVLCLGGLGPAATGPDPAFRYTVAGTGPLVLLESPFASLVDPFAEFVAEEEQRHPGSTFTIVMPMAIPRYRFDGLLLNQRGLNMRRSLDARRNRVFTLVRYYLPA